MILLRFSGLCGEVRKLGERHVHAERAGAGLHGEEAGADVLWDGALGNEALKRSFGGTFAAMARARTTSPEAGGRPSRRRVR